MASTKKPQKKVDSPCPDWLSRVIKERNDLQKRLSKLCTFMDTKIEGCEFLKLPPADKILLERQQELMMAYRDILDVRIALHGGEK